MEREKPQHNCRALDEQLYCFFKMGEKAEEDRICPFKTREEMLNCKLYINHIKGRPVYSKQNR